MLHNITGQLRSKTVECQDFDLKCVVGGGGRNLKCT